MTVAPLVAAEFDELVSWVRERESIRKKKEAGLPRPWTSDPLLLRYRFCNVSRMDDRVSRSLMRHWYQEGPPSEQLVAATLGRLVNWPDSLYEASGGTFFSMRLLPEMRERLRQRAARGDKWLTGAYIVPGVPGRSKIDSIMDLVQLVATQAEALFKPTLRETWAALTTLPGLGSFLAGQVAADVAQLSAGQEWPDRFSFAPVGPGSARGMNRLRGRPKQLALRQEQFDMELADLTEALRKVVPDIFCDRKLCAQDTQSLCCEFDKARRLQLGEGKVRAGYDGAGDAQVALL